MARRNPNSTARDMIISMAVLLVPIVLLVWLFTDDPAPEPEAIDVAPYLQQAEAESPYPVFRPANLPDGWTPVRAVWARDGALWADNQPAVGNSWLLGYVSPDGIHFGIEQRDRSVNGVITRVTREGRPADGAVEAAGHTWERYESGDGRTRSLVTRDGEMVAIVAADTSFEALEAFATTLVTE